MANIVHASAGTSKNLAVTGTVVELPHLDNILFDFQIDYGISKTGTSITSWARKTGACDYDDPTNVTADSANKLMGIDTVKLAAGRFITSNGHAGGRYWHNTPANRVIPIAFIAKLPASADIYWCSSYTGGNYTTFKISLTTTKLIVTWIIDGERIPHTAEFTHGVSITDWNTYMVVIDYVSQTIDAAVNGVSLGKITGITDLIWFALSPDSSHHDAIGAGYTGTASLNIAALIGWKAISFTEDDYLNAYMFLKMKYGLE